MKFRAEHGSKLLTKGGIRVRGVGDMEGELAGGRLDSSVGEVVGVDKTAVMDVDEEVIMGKEVGTNEGQRDVSNHELPGIGLVCNGNGHLLHAVCLDGGPVGSHKTDIRALAKTGGQRLRQEGTAGTSIHKVTDVRPAIC